MKPSPVLLLVLNTLFVFGSLVFAGGSQAQTFPSKPIVLIGPYPEGGVSASIAKHVGASLSSTLKQTVLVENLGGESGVTAVQKVLNAPSDGHTLLQASPSELVLVPFVNKNAKFKSEDFRMVQFVVDTPLIIVARKGLDANNADELAVLARRSAALGRPLVYASSGVSSYGHMLGSHISRQINAPMLHAPYPNTAQVVKGLVDEQIDFVITAYNDSQLALHTSGKVKIIAALSAQRQPAIPDVPSVDEGVMLKGYHHSTWFAYFVKKRHARVHSAGLAQSPISNARQSHNSYYFSI